MLTTTILVSIYRTLTVRRQDTQIDDLLHIEVNIQEFEIGSGRLGLDMFIHKVLCDKYGFKNIGDEKYSVIYDRDDPRELNYYIYFTDDGEFNKWKTEYRKAKIKMILEDC